MKYKLTKLSFWGILQGAHQPQQLTNFEKLDHWISQLIEIGVLKFRKQQQRASVKQLFF